MGLPGSGKGTQGKLLADRLGYSLISTGELLRNYGSEDQHKRMKAGQILEDQEVTEMLSRALAEMPDKNRVILDGYPRRISQAEWLNDLHIRGDIKLQAIIYIKVPENEITERLLARGRPDDSEDSIKKRFMEYAESTYPIIEYYRNKSLEMIEVNGQGSIQEIQNNVLKSLKLI